MSLTSKLLLISAIAVVAVVSWVSADYYVAHPLDTPRDYVGRESCIQCHQEQGEKFTGSHHDWAMEHANSETVLGDFDEQVFEHRGISTRIFTEDNKYFMTTEGPDGKMGTFEVKYTFGFEPLQQYLVEFPDGRIQALSIAWDTTADKWYHLYPDEEIPHDDWLHWTKGGQNWNYMCAECHSTGLEKGYDAESDTYNTTWFEMDVSCEACHGPGSLHVELANSNALFWDRNHGKGLKSLRLATSREQIETCAPCHSRRRIVHPGYSPGADFEDYYAVELLEGDLYFDDGQIRDEVYVYGSFLQSRMHREGVKCTDCHDPHSAKLHAEGNALCIRCHTQAKYDVPAHHHHKLDSPGAQCVECHMTERRYMGVDDRRDHSFRIPRPDLAARTKSPNACTQCHKDKPVEWAASALSEWLGGRELPEHFGTTFHSAKQRIGTSKDSLMSFVRSKSVGPTVRASALALLGRAPDMSMRDLFRRSLSDKEPMVRVEAAKQLELFGDALMQTELLPLLSDPVRLVRTEVARILSATPLQQLSSQHRAAFDAAIQEYVTGQEFLADQAVAHHNLGIVFANMRDADRALSEYEDAIRRDPTFHPARHNLAMLLYDLKRLDDAESQFREVIKRQPKLGEAHYNLALMISEDPARILEAIPFFKSATELLPNHPRVSYNLAMAYRAVKDNAKAEPALREACRRDRTSVDAHHALALLYIEQENWKLALELATYLKSLAPNRPDFLQMESQLIQQINR